VAEIIRVRARLPWSNRCFDAFHRLPGPTRSAVASLRGLYLRSWRYGAETERYVAEEPVRANPPAFAVNGCHEIESGATAGQP
jgi:hypothetical protein